MDMAWRIAFYSDKVAMAVDGWPAGIRAKGREGIGRAFFCTVHEGRVLILHALVKKTERTPGRDLAIARDRLQEVRHAEG
jgi:phage-related protein